MRRDSLFWSPVGLLDSVHTRDSLNVLTRVGFGYDGLGRRIRKSTPSDTSRYLWDGANLVAELNSSGNVRAGYTYGLGIDQPSSVLRHDRGDTTYYYLTNQPGNVVALLKKTGSSTTIANSYTYDPYGGAKGATVTVPDALRYAGREYDAETQLYYNRARYYDPALGRFISEDPAGLSAGINLYAYVGNDPLNGRDPSGLCGGSGDPEMWSPATYVDERGGGCGNGEHLADLQDFVMQHLPVYSGGKGVYAATDAWMMANYGFGVAAALNRTNGDCTFSGSGVITCAAGSAFGGKIPVALAGRQNDAWKGCPLVVAFISPNLSGEDGVWVLFRLAKKSYFKIPGTKVRVPIPGGVGIYGGAFQTPTDNAPLAAAGGMICAAGYGMFVAVTVPIS